MCWEILQAPIRTITHSVYSLEERIASSNENESNRNDARSWAVDKEAYQLEYPTPGDVRDTMAKEQFIDALVDSNMRLRVKLGRPTNLNGDIRHELEAFIETHRKMLQSQSLICAL